MNTHLSSQEFVNALDGVLASARQSHLDGCAACQTQVAELRALTEEAVHGADVPEPSPLFWDHFQSRVLAAVQGQGRPEPQAWWKNWADARALFALSAIVVAVVASVALYVSRPAAPVPATVADSGEVAASDVMADAALSLDGDEWEFVTSVMGTLEDDDIREVLAPSHHAVDAAIEGLTSAERDRFMELLKAELAEGLESIE